MPFRREFEFRKKMVLKALMSEGKDKSRKGSVDAPIADLINCINSHPWFFTTSSCSGRVSIFLEQPSAHLNSAPYEEVEDNSNATGAKSKVKQGGSWVYVSHEAVEVDEVLLRVRSLYQETKQEKEGVLVFRFEPFILALECSSFPAAQRMFACAMASGYRETGISSVGKRLIVAVRSSIRLEVPIGEKGKLLVPEEYLRFLTESANKKFVLNQQRIDRFLSTFMAQFDGTISHSFITTTDPSKAPDLKAGHRRRKGLNLLVRDKLLSCLQTRQSKIILRINSLETDASLVLSVLKSLQFTDGSAPKLPSALYSGRFQHMYPEA